MFARITLLLLLVTLSLACAFAAGPQPLTETNFSYQSNGDPMSQTLSWADGRQSAQLNNIQQQTTQIFYSQATPTSLCKAELPTALNFSSITSGLICLSQTHYLQSSPASNNQATPITSLAYIDSRTGELLAKASPKEKGDPKGDVTRYQYDQLGRTRAITYHLGQTDQIKAIISYLSAGNSTNQTGYNQVIVTKPDEVKQRTLTDGLGQVVAKQVNTCPDGTSSIAGCTPGALMPDGQFRRVSSASYTNSEGVVQPQIQTSTDALGATTEYQYDALGRPIAITTSEQPVIIDKTLVKVTRGVIYDQVNRLQVSYQQVVGSVRENDPHAVQVQYFNTSGKVKQTQLIPLHQLEQGYQSWQTLHPNEPVCSASTLFTGDDCRAALAQYLANKPDIGQRQTTHYNGLLQKQQQQSALQQLNYQYNDRELPDNTSIQALGATNHQPVGPQYQSSVQYNLLGKVISHTLRMQPPSAADLRADEPIHSHTGAYHDYNSLGELTNLASTQTKPLLSSGFTYNKDGQLTRRTNVDVNTDGTISQITYYRIYNNQGQTVASWDVAQAQADCSTLKAAAQDYKVWTYYQPGNSQGQPAGKLKSVTFNGSGNPDTITYAYYLDGALEQVSYANGLSIHYQYNAAGQTTQVSYLQEGTVENQSHYLYGQGTVHQLLKVTSGTAQVSYQYNDQGNPTVIKRTNDASLWVTTSKNYSGYDLLKASATCRGDSCQIDSPQAQQQVEYTYIQGQLTQVTVKHPQLNIVVTDPRYSSFNYSKAYSYDGLGRLTGVSTTTVDKTKSLNKVAYTLDINNNIQAISGNHPISYTYNAIDQLTGEAGSHWQPEYVADNLTNGPGGSQYQYNNLNQLIQYTSPGGEITNYQYYPDGTLQSESQGPTHKLTFYYSDGQIALVKDNRGNWASYLGGLTREAVIYHHAGGKNQVDFYAYQGKTPSGWLGQSGTTWQQRDPYGLSEAVYQTTGTQPATPLSLADNPQLMGFNGNYQDPVSDNVFMGVRVYNPSLQRFLQLDSYDVSNRYAFAQDNPIEKYDPSGHMAKWLKWFLGAGLSALGTIVGFASFGVGLSAAIAAETAAYGFFSGMEVASGFIGAVGSTLQETGNDLQLSGVNTTLAKKLNLASNIIAGVGFAADIGANIGEISVTGPEKIARELQKKAANFEAAKSYFKKIINHLDNQELGEIEQNSSMLREGDLTKDDRVRNIRQKIVDAANYELTIWLNGQSIEGFSAKEVQESYLQDIGKNDLFDNLQQAKAGSKRALKEGTPGGEIAKQYQDGVFESLFPNLAKILPL